MNAHLHAINPKTARPENCDAAYNELREERDAYADVILAARKEGGAK